MISYIIPTRDRHDQLIRTLSQLDRLGDCRSVGGCEVVVVDNASESPVTLPEHLPRGTRVRVVRLERNLGAAARNVGVDHADPRSSWVIMLDDDSAPLDDGFELAIRRAPPYAAAVAADIFLGEDEDRIAKREDGGLPEVFVGCGVALRREVYTKLGGYDADFGFYAEEYDLSARLIAAGHRILFSPIFRVLHRKVASGRDMNLIVRRLVRNNAWVCQRYAPQTELEQELARIDERCRWIAEREDAMDGYKLGRADAAETIATQARTPMDPDLWDRFTGLAAAREALSRRLPKSARAAELVGAGKNAHIVQRALTEAGIRVVDQGADVRVIATMSPGPMLDAIEQATPGVPVIAPWLSARSTSVFGEVAA